MINHESQNLENVHGKPEMCARTLFLSEVEQAFTEKKLSSSIVVKAFTEKYLFSSEVESACTRKNIVFVRS